MTAVKRGLIRRKSDVDMTEGSIIRHLLAFALPLLVGNLFQQLYNTVDTWVLGNYAGNEAYAGVGSLTPIINTLIGFFTGLSSGAGAVISQFYGAKREDKVHDTVHTAILLTLLLSVAFTVVGWLISPYMLQLMKTPENVFDESLSYLRIYFAGVLGLMLYNIGAGILRAVGDSRRPFYFLVVSALTNTVLDLLFVVAFDMGVEGVAYATILAQGMSALLVVLTLMRSKACIRLIPSHLKIHRDMLGKIFQVGLPAGLQMMVTSFSNVFVQSYINFFGDDCMSGWTSYTKIDQVLLLPMQSLALASTTFVAQNLGSKQVKRAKKGAFTALILSIASMLILMVPLLILAPQLVGFFNDKPEVIEYGVMLLRYISPFYLLCCINQIYAGALRGAGNSRAPMIIMLASFVVFRQVYLYVMANFISNEVLPIAMSYPAGWLLASLLTLLYYNKVKLESTRLVDDEPSEEQA